MKKLFILLGVVMFSILGCSCEKPKPVHQHYFIEGICECGEEDSNYEPPHEHEFVDGKCSCGEIIFVEIKYNVSELSDYLHRYTRGEAYAACWDMPELLNLENLTYWLEKEDDRAYIVTIGEKTRDYYICGYLSNDIKEFLTENYACRPFGEDFSGYNGYFAGWTNLSLSSSIDQNEYPIIWYEIPKDEDIPFEINDMFLVLVGETINITFESIDGLVKFQQELIYENKKFYYEKWSEERVDELLSRVDGDIILWRKKPPIDPTSIMIIADFMTHSVTFGFNVEDIDGIRYVNVLDYTTLYKGEDLKEKHEYILDKSGNVLFKLEDIKYVFEKGE